MPGTMQAQQSAITTGLMIVSGLDFMDMLIPDNEREQCAELTNAIMRVNGWPMTGRDIPGTVIVDACRLSGNEPILVE